MGNEALCACENFFRMYYDGHDIPGAARYLAEDAAWFGDSAVGRGFDRAQTLEVLRRGVEAGAWEHRLLKLDLRELASPGEGVRLVEGNLLFLDEKSGYEKTFHTTAVLKRRGAECEICQIHHHFVGDTRLGVTDRYFSALFGKVPWGVLILEHKGGAIRLNYFNELTASMLGYSPDEFKALFAQDFRAFAAPEDLPIIDEKLARLLAGREPVDFRFRSRSRQGYIWVHMVAQATKWINGMDLLVLSIVDVTREIEAQNLLQSMISNVPGGVVTFEVRGRSVRQVFLNEGFLKHLGYSYGDLPARNDISEYFYLIHPDDLPLVYEVCQAVLDGQNQADFTFRLQKKDGPYLWINLRGSMYQSTGDCRLFFGIYTDVDDKVRALAEVAAAKGELEKVITSLPGGVAVFELAGEAFRPLFFSDQLCRIFGMTRRQIAEIGSPEPSSEQPNAGQAQGLRALWRSLRSGEGANSVELSVRKLDGTPIWVRVVSQCERQSDSKLIYVIVHDITGEVIYRQAERWQAERYRILSEGSDATVFDYDPVSRVMTYCFHVPGTAVRDETIPSFDEAIFKTTLLHPDDRLLCKNTLDKAAGGALKGTAELRLQLRNSGYRWHRIHYVGLAGADGKVFRVIGRLEDIQREKDAEAIVRAEIRREALYRRAMTAGAVLALTFDMTTGERIASGADIRPAWLPDDLPLDGVLDFLRDHALHPSDREALSASPLREECERLLRDRSGTILREFRVRPASAEDSEYRWTGLALTAALDESLRYLYAFLALTDRHEKKLRELAAWEEANLDALTRLPNQTCFARELSARLKAANDRGCALVVIRIDVDALLESSGPDAVNDLIRKISQTVRVCAHQGELCCRLSADEFALYVPEAPEEAMFRERLRMLCAAMRRDDGGVEVTASVGCALHRAGEVRPEVILSQAISATRWAHRQGGNRYAVYAPEMGGQIEDRGAAPLAPQGGGKRVFLRTFGYFDVFIGGRAVLFSSAKAKELLALLMDRKGGFVTAADAIAHLWESEPTNATTLARYRKTAMRLKNILEENGIGDIVETIHGNRRIVVDLIDCDYYAYLSADPAAVSAFTGAYLADYSWAEETAAMLDAKRSRGSGHPGSLAAR